MEHSLQAILAQPALLTGVPDETLQAWIERYPYVPLFRLEQYKRTRTYDDALQTSFRIHNREILYQLLYGRDETAEVPVPESKPAIDVMPAPETTMEEIPEVLPVETAEEPVPVSPEIAVSPEITEEIAADTDTPVVEVQETLLPVEASEEMPQLVPEPEQPSIPVTRSIADDVLESIRRLKLEREGKIEPETAAIQPVLPEAIAPLPVDEAAPGLDVEIEVRKAPEPEPQIPVPDIEVAAPAESFEVIAAEPVAIAGVESGETEPQGAGPADLVEVEESDRMIRETIVTGESQVLPSDNLYIPDVEEDLIEAHEEPGIEPDKASQVEAIVADLPLSAPEPPEPVQAARAEIYIPPLEGEGPVQQPAEPEPSPASVPDNAPHTFLEWIRMIDGGVTVEKPFDNQPKEDWIEIPRFELEFQQEHKNVYKVEDFEGELDQQEDLDEDLNRVAGESVEFKQDMMTETLAKIYVKQGKIDKALIIYNTLRLKFPEKSAYFAALIQNLEKGE